MNHKKRFTAIVLLAILLALFQGCIKYSYKVSDIRNNMNGFSHKLDETITSVDQFKNDQWSGYNYLAKQLDDTAGEPFPQLFSSLKKMSATADKLKMYPPVLTDIRTEFEDFVANKNSIESGTPEWDALKLVNSKYMSLVDSCHDLIDEVNDMKEEVKKKEMEVKEIINAKR